MKIFLLITLLFLIAGCDLVKPLPGNESITFGKEGFGIDKLADKFMEKADEIKDYVDDLKLEEDAVKENKSMLGLGGEEEYVNLSSVTDGGGSGTATRLYNGGQFTLEVISELSVPKDDYFYECWLAGGGEPISAGKLVRETDGKYHLKFIVNNDYINYSSVVVTLETDDDNSAPAATVLQGEFLP